MHYGTLWTSAEWLRWVSIKRGNGQYVLARDARLGRLRRPIFALASEVHKVPTRIHREKAAGDPKYPNLVLSLTSLTWWLCMTGPTLAQTSLKRREAQGIFHIILKAYADTRRQHGPRTNHYAEGNEAIAKIFASDKSLTNR
jgi:hypothetical protein